MGSPAIFSGRRTKLLTADGLLNSNGSIIDSNGVREYIANGHAEVNVAGWATYADAAGARPVDGTGGTSTITLTRSTTTPLLGSASFILTSPGTVQGQGVSYDFTIDSKDKAKVLQINLDYMVNSGTFVAGTSTTDSDLIAYIYNVGDAVLLEPSSIKFLSSSTTLSDKLSATFQTSSISTTYRLILHSATASAAFSLKLDNISVSPSVYVYGSPVTDWQSYTPTFVGLGTVANVNFKSRKVGDTLEVFGYFQAGTPTAVAATISLGYAGGNGNVTVDTGKVPSFGVLGYGGSNTPPTGTYFGNLTILANGATNNVSMGVQTSSLNALSVSFGSVIVAASSYLSMHFSVPILGWASSVQMSDSADTRVVAASFTTLSATAYTFPNAVKYTTKAYDTHAAFNTTTGEYTCPVAGFYRLTVASSYLTVTTAMNWNVYKNGVLAIPFFVQSTVNRRVNGNITIQCIVGDKLTIVLETSDTFGSTDGLLNIERVTGPSAIAATEEISLLYYNTASTSMGVGSNQIPFATRIYDSHGAWSGTQFKPPIAGRYQITIKNYFGATAWTAASKYTFLRRNAANAEYASITMIYATVTNELFVQGVLDVDLTASEIIDFTLNHNEAAAKLLSSAGNLNSIAIKKIK